MKHDPVAALISIPPLALAAHLPRLIFATLLMLVAATSVSQSKEVPVTNTEDGGEGSLRQAIASASSGDTITFSLPANSVIALTDGSLSIDKNLTINGPGANQLTMARSRAEDTAKFRIFHIGAAGISAAISGLTIANGDVGFGGDGGGVSNLGI